MKLCDTCIYRNNVEQLKPCIIYRDDCEYYEREEDMKAIIQIDVPNYQIGQEVSIYFKDTMMIKGIVQEPKMGHWIDINGIYAECSNCNEEIYITGDFKYCPNCGAKMSEIPISSESNRTCHTCKHYTSGEHDGSCGSYICKGYSNWEMRY